MSDKKQHNQSRRPAFDAEVFIRHLHLLMDEGQYGVENLALTLNMSVQTFRRRIRSVTGLSPLAYLTSRRMEKAVALLTDARQIPVSVIAAHCGFSECSSFTHAFRRFYGISPAQYREKHTIKA